MSIFEDDVWDDPVHEKECCWSQVDEDIMCKTVRVVSIFWMGDCALMKDAPVNDHRDWVQECPQLEQKVVRRFETYALWKQVAMEPVTEHQNN